MLEYFTVMKQHFLQSPAWEQFQQEQGQTTARITSKNAETLTILRHTALGDYLFAPYGPTLQQKSDLETALKDLKTAARAKNAIFVRIEPTLPFTDAEMRKFSLKKTHDIEPRHTWVLDLSPDEDTLLAGMESRKVRYYRNYAKKGMTIRASHDPADMKILFKHLTEVSQNDNFQTFDEAYLTAQLKYEFATLYIVEFEGEPIASALTYDTADTCYYAHTGADYAHRKLNAGIILLVHMILEAKRHGRKKFDFWGVTTSEDPSHPWYGFTKFKKSFGGELVTYAGTWDLVLKPLHYRAYQLLRPLNKLRRKLRH